MKTESKKKLEGTRERERERKGRPPSKRSGPGDVVRQATTTPAVVLCSLLSFISFILSFFIPLGKHFLPPKQKRGKQKKKTKKKQKKKPKKLKSRRERERTWPFWLLLRAPMQLIYSKCRNLPLRKTN